MRITANMSYIWDDKTVLLLIEKFRENDLLWNPPKKSNFRDKNKRVDAVTAIADLFGTNASEIERKWKNITSHYFREQKKFEETLKSSGEVRVPKWFAYKALDFLRGKRKPDAQDDQHQQPSTSQFIAPTRKRKAIHTEDAAQFEETPGTCCHSYNNQPESETEIVAKGWAFKLNRIDPEQRRFAEKIVNDTLFEAEMKSLTRHGVKFLTSPLLTSEDNGIEVVVFKREQDEN